MRNITINGVPKQFPVKPQIFPDGHEHFRIESGILHADPDGYIPFKPGIEFTIAKVSFSKDHIELELDPTNGGQQHGFVQFMFERDWQKSQSNSSLLTEIEQTLSSPKVGPQASTGSPLLDALLGQQPSNAEHRLPPSSLPPPSSNAPSTNLSNANALLPTGLIGTKVHTTLGKGQELEYTVQQMAILSDAQQGDYIQVKIVNPLPEHANEQTTVNIRLPKDWQSTLKREDIAKLINQALPDPATYDAMRKKVEENYKELEKKHAAERGRAEAAFQAKIEPFQRIPRSGKPTYDETSSWIGTNLAKIKMVKDGSDADAYQYHFKSMGKCVLIYDAEHTYTNPKRPIFDIPDPAGTRIEVVPLSDVLGVSDEYVEMVNEYGNHYDAYRGRRRFIDIETKHNGRFRIWHDTDWDTNDLASRLVKALNHSANLCASTPSKTNEPF